MLRDLIISKVRIKILQTFLYQPQELFYVRQLVRATGEEINAVRRELLRMEKAGMVQKETRGNRLYYWFNQNHPLFGDLLSLINKTIGLGKAIIENKTKIGKIKFAVLSGRFARRLPTREGGVDLLMVGEVNMPKLVEIVKIEEEKQEREINYSVMSKQEFEFRKKRRDPFLLGILTSSRLMLIGDEEELASRTDV
ncbi:MAG TPA: hypothetical protein VMX76_01200 [Nevskiaceae bacterium]|nr:hypothetical protein [Nevskiaceae bacterium]